MFLRICLLLLPLLCSTAAFGARRVKCDSCASCTTALAQPGASVELTADLTSDAGVCLTIAGAGAELNGGEHTLKSKGVGVKVTADGAHLRRLSIEGGDAGVEVTAKHVTVHAVKVKQAKVGVKGDGAEALRVVRSELTGGQVGLALGMPAGKQCPAGAKMRSPGVVLSRVTVTGAKVGVAACEATPVIMGSTISKNELGLLVGNPKGAGKGKGLDGPWDPCVCGPSLDEVKSETTLFFSSGCGGCKVHEGWLPEVQQQGYDILLRPTGAENKQKMATYDAFLRQCAPEVNDAIGIPGCVPNYACLPGHSVFKRRDTGKKLIRDHQIQGPDGMAEFAARCAAEAQMHYNVNGTCVAHAVRQTTLCGNKVDAQLARPLTGDDNACGQIKGGGDKMGCARKCDAR